MHESNRPSPVPFTIAGVVLSGILLALGWSRMSRGTFVHNDDIARATQIRDLWNGQGWFDLHQYRLGLEPPIVMHWTRHIDVLVTIIAAPFRLILSDETALQVAGVILPLGLAWALLWVGSRVAKIVGGQEAVIPSLFLMSISGWTISQFTVGRIDHHGLQIVLALTLLVAILKFEQPKFAILGAVAAGIALSIGLEAVGVVAGAMLTAGLIYIRVGQKAAQSTGLFFLGMPLAAVLSTLLFGPIGRLSTAACDVFSRPTLWPLAAIGLAVLGATRLSQGTATRRFLLIGGSAAVGIGLVAAMYPECLEGPYAFVDPWLRAHWMTKISEMQNVVGIFEKTPGWVLGWAFPTVLVLILGVRSLVKDQASNPRWRIVPFIIPPILIALSQARGVPIVTALISPFLAVWFLRAVRSLPLASPVTNGLVKSGVIIVLSGVLLPLIWAPAEASSPNACEQPDIGALAEFSSGSLVLAHIDLGPELLIEHPTIQVMAAPYHRNNPGNLLASQFPQMSVIEAGQALQAAEVDYYLLCDSGQTGVQDTIDAALLNDDVPAFLQELPVEGPLRLFETVGF